MFSYKEFLNVNRQLNFLCYHVFFHILPLQPVEDEKIPVNLKFIFLEILLI